LAGILTFTDKVIDPEYSRRIQEEIMLTQVERLIYSDGHADGKREGREEGYSLGEKKMAELNNRLLREKRTDDALRVSTDIAYRQKLYEEYNIN